jgi:SAM-dependent methyltransferase
MVPEAMSSADKAEPERQPESFDAVAEYYDQHRAAYPQQVEDAVIALSRLHRGSRVLEIGCGTGQLSVTLAKQGVDLLAVELGPRLAARARHNLAPYPNARVEVSSFEDWLLERETFDVVVSASAFHWLDPAIRCSKSADALRPGGFLTILHVHHVSGGGSPDFFADTQPCYVKWGLSRDPSFLPPTANCVASMYPELDDLPEFSSVERRRFEIARRYSTTSYIGWLETDSLINTLATASRRDFLEAIRHVIESKYGGAVERNYVYEVIAAERGACMRPGVT